VKAVVAAVFAATCAVTTAAAAVVDSGCKVWFVVGIIVVVVGIIVVVVVVVVILVAVVHAKVVRNQFGLHDGSLQVFYGERGLGMAARGGVLILRDGGRDEEGGSGVGMGNKVHRKVGRLVRKSCS